MIRIFTYCFDNWLRPIIFFLLTFGLFAVSELLDYSTIQNLCFLLFGLGLLALIISTIYQFHKRRWLKAILTTLLFILTVVGFVLYSIAMFWKLQSEPDKFADNLVIPKNIKIYVPSESIYSSEDSIPNFNVYDSFQPGLYHYVLWTRKIEKGYCYLKAFEITQDYPLSVDKLKERSIIKVSNPTDTVTMFEMGKGKYNSDRDFTIYEGDWGKPYAARFEVWFVPDNGGQERKLLEKNYKIEGWQR